MKKKNTTVLFILIFIFGLSLLLYPSLSNYWNSMHSTKAIGSYAEEVATLDEDRYQHLWEDARTYNDELRTRANQYVLDEEQNERYHELLNIGGTGIMGYIEIESLGVSLPIYHGTDDTVLQIAVGHLEWTSLPVGGEGTHTVLSGHRGLPSAKLFTDLDELVVGDTFILRILDEILTYEVDQILIVDPKDTSALATEDGMDYCTLITCTPYGVNSHRLLVRGHRVENAEAAKIVRLTSDAVQIEPLLVAPVVALPILLILLIILMLPKRPKYKRGGISFENL